MSDIKCDTSPSDRTRFELFHSLFSGFKWRISTSPCWPFGGPNVENVLRLFLQKVCIDHKLLVCICGRTVWSETCLLHQRMICIFVNLSCGIYVGKGDTEKGFCPSISVVIPPILHVHGIESRWGRDFPPVQTGPETYPASCKMGTGSFLGVKCGRAVLLTTHPPSSAAVMEE